LPYVLYKGTRFSENEQTLKFTFVGVTEISGVAEYEVVGKLYVHVGAGHPELACNLVVAAAGRGIAGRVIVAKHDGGRQFVDGVLEYDLGVDRRFRDAAVADTDGVDDAVLVIHEQDPAFFVRQIYQAGVKQLVDVTAVADLDLFDHFGRAAAFAQFHGGRYGDSFGGAYSKEMFAECVYAHLAQFVQIVSGMAHDAFGQVDCTFSL
jgi:hypothetical protein